MDLLLELAIGSKQDAVDLAELSDQVAPVKALCVLGEESLTRDFQKFLIELLKQSLVLKSAVNTQELRILLKPLSRDLHILKVDTIEACQHAPQDSPDDSLVVLVKARLYVLEAEVHEWFHQLDIIGSEKNEAREVTVDFLNHPKELRDDSDLNFLDL